MVCFLAAVLFAAQQNAPLVLASKTEAVDVIRSLGFSMKAEPVDAFEIARDGSRCRLYINDPQLDGSTRRIKALWLSWEFEFPKQIPDDIAETLPASKPAWSYDNGLNGILGLTCSVQLDSSTTKQDLAKQLDSLWRARKNLALEVVGPLHGKDQPGYRASRQLPVDESQTIHSISRADVEYLLGQWSWKAKVSSIGGGSTWYLPGSIDGTQVGFSSYVRSMRYSRDSELTLSHRLDLPKETNIQKWSTDHQSGLGQVRLLATPGDRSPAEISDRIDFRPGITLGVLKKRILDFAKLAKSLG